MEARGCGARKGARPTCAPAGSVPLGGRVDARHREGLVGAERGNRPGSRSASIVLPEPGGPIIKRWCGPAAATSRGAPTEPLYTGLRLGEEPKFAG